MKVYGVCWQDVTEPWGWEPESLWFTREQAEAELASVEHASDERSIQEYTVRAREGL